MEEILTPWRLNKQKTDAWHSMCSYLGAFPPTLANYFINHYSKEGDIVYDPFSGRGTTLLESRLLGRNAIATDLNPIALSLCKAKNHDLPIELVLERITLLEERYDPALFMPEAKSQDDNIQLIFHPKTMAQLCYLKRKLLKSTEPIDEFLVGAILGLLHGGERKDQTSGYASVSMPNTFSMSPEYVRKFVQQKQINRIFRNVFEILREKVGRLYEFHGTLKGTGRVIRQDVKEVANNADLEGYVGKISLILTSPPYLGVVNYARQNWIRSWFLDKDPKQVHEELDDDLNLNDWIKFSYKYMEQLKKFMKKDGIAVFVIGDVAKSKTCIIPLAREFALMIRDKKIFKYVWVVPDKIADNGKTTRIWGDTKGAATTIDRIVILADYNPFEKMKNDVSGTVMDYKNMQRSTADFMGWKGYQQMGECSVF